MPAVAMQLLQASEGFRSRMKVGSWGLRLQTRAIFCLYASPKGVMSSSTQCPTATVLELRRWDEKRGGFTTVVRVTGA